MRIRALTLILLLPSCRRSSEERLTPDDWDAMSSQLAECFDVAVTTAGSGDMQPWALRRPTAEVRWPSDMVERPATERSRRAWVGSDSSTVELTISAEPAGGLASNLPLVIENRCALPVAGRRAMTHRLRHDIGAAQPPRYFADATVVLREDVAINAWIEAPSARRRDQLLYAFGALVLKK